MDKKTEANFNLGEVGVFVSIGLGVVGIGLATAAYFGSKCSSESSANTVGSIVGIIVALAGAGVYYLAYRKWKAYRKIRNKIK